jgi:hypothetical protein
VKGLKKGPELKMPELKVPDFLFDLFYDLRDRRLLAPIALVIVAIAAVPFLLGGGAEESAAPAGDGAATSAVEGETARAATLTVVEATPGLRDYRKRLSARQPTNPFKQRYTSPDVDSAELNPQSGSASTAGTVTVSGSSESTTVQTAPTAPSSPSSTPSPSPSTPAADGNGKSQLTFFTWAIDVRIVKSSGEEADPGWGEEPSVKREVLAQTPLPGEKAPVVTYMGLSRKAAEKDAARALLLVSEDVKSVSGEAKCLARGEIEQDACQLVEVEPGVPVTFIYGANETRYRLKLLNVELVVTGHS